MPKITRKQRQSKAKEPVEPPAAAPPEPAATPAQQLTERVRVRCPCCGMLPEDFRISGGPYPFEVKIQQFGGNAFIRYNDHPELIDQWKPIIIEKLKAALQLLGEE